MRKIVLTAAIGASVALASTCFAMGGMGGGGGSMGGYGGGNSGAGFDDYSTAVRLIHHEKYAEAQTHMARLNCEILEPANL